MRNSKPVAIIAKVIAYLSYAVVWINENGNPFRDQGLVTKDE